MIQELLKHARDRRCSYLRTRMLVPNPSRRQLRDWVVDMCNSVIASLGRELRGYEVRECLIPNSRRPISIDIHTMIQTPQLSTSKRSDCCSNTMASDHNRVIGMIRDGSRNGS
jgi:hypothetical protein